MIARLRISSRRAVVELLADFDLMGVSMTGFSRSDRGVGMIRRDDRPAAKGRLKIAGAVTRLKRA
jgi:hypothetical protein